MESTTRSQAGPGLGRESAKLCSELRRAILAGKLAAGTFIPTQRELSTRHGVAHTTVRRALKQLIAEGLIVNVPRRGFRVLPKASDPNRGCPVAYVPDPSVHSASRGPFHAYLFVALRKAAGRRGWSLLAAGSEGISSAETVAGLQSQRAFGVVLNTDDQGVLEAVEHWGVPAVIVDGQAEGRAVDSVMQDGQQGGVLAARYLHARGCRRVAWFGPLQGDAHVLERFGGAVAGLTDCGIGLPPELQVGAHAGMQRQTAERLLSGGQRPDGIIVLWREPAIEVVRTATRLGLRVGRDLHVVGWCPEELYDTDVLGRLEGLPIPPVVSWRVADMAELALARLSERRENPGMPALRVKVPVTLRPGSGD
jgi:DNA-binding LacI/PurR family transcriptional regulator